MGKKVNLNAPRNNNSIHKSNHHNFYHPSTINNINTDENQDGKEPNALQKKGAEIALKSVGVPSGLAKTLSEDKRTYEMAKKMQGTIIFPKSTKIIITAALIAIPFVLILIFVMFADDESTSGSSIGNYMYGETCTKITITDTDCNVNGDNCTNKYNGTVNFETYIEGVVAANDNTIDNLEYYKIQAIKARTKVLSSVDSDCTVKGNNDFQKYIDINDSPYKDNIKKAVQETKGLVLIENNDLVEKKPISITKISKDTNNYYIKYKTSNSNSEQSITIDKNQSYVTNFSKELDKYVNNTSTSYSSADEWVISDLITIHLITEKNYKYEEIIDHYYGNKVKSEENKVNLSGVNGFTNPTRTIRCTSPFGYRIHPVKGGQSFHGGLDIGIAGGEPIYAAKSGTITTIKKNVSAINNCNYGYGNYIIISHEDNTSTLYAHMKYGTIPSNLKEGSNVKQGQQIGQVGSTGCSTGNHLHYEVIKNGDKVNPADYIDLTNASGTCR